MRKKQQQIKRKKQTNIQDTSLHRKIVAPQKLKILVLSRNDISNDHLDFLGKCINLIKLDLSHNFITKLPQKIQFKNLNKLQVFQIHNNKIGSVDGLRPIYLCKNITYLTFHDNLITNQARSQHEVINQLMNLKVINRRVVFLQQRSNLLFLIRKQIFVDSQMLQSWKSMQNSQIYYLKVLNMQLQYIQNMWAFNNPIIVIQRAIKHFYPANNQTHNIQKRSISNQSKTQYLKKQYKINQKTHQLKQYFKQWKQYYLTLKVIKKQFKQKIQGGNKYHYTFSLDKYQQQLRNHRVQDPLRAFLKRIRRKIHQRKMLAKFVAHINLKRTLFDTLQGNFYDISGVNQTNKIYYNKSQQHILDNFLNFIAQKFNKRQAIYNQSKFQQNKLYNAIRLVDSQTLNNRYKNQDHYLSMGCLIFPSMKVVITGRRKIPTNFQQGIIGIKQLSYIKNRDKILSYQQKQKSIQVYRRLQKFAQNQYVMSMWTFECKDQFVMRHLIRMIYYHNAQALHFQHPKQGSNVLSLIQNYKQPFVFYIDKVLVRTRAAVIIQKTWRRFISNKNQPESIYFKIKKNRAALHIQKFFRNMVFNHRTLFNKKIYEKLNQYQNQSLIYPLQFYLNLKNLDSNKIQLFKNVGLTRKQHQIGVSQQYNRPIFQKNIRSKFFNNQNIGAQIFQTKIDLFNLVHYNTKVNIIYRNEKKFVKIVFNSKNQANICASIIALYTYQMWGKLFVFPLYKQNMQKWSSQLLEQTKIKKIGQTINQSYFSKYNSNILINKQIQTGEIFIWTSQNTKIKKQIIKKVQVQFYQKKYHSFPVKYDSQFLIYYDISFKDKINQKIFQNTNVVQIQENNIKILRNKLDGTYLKNKQIQNGPLTINPINQKKIAFFDHSHRSLKVSQQKIPEINKTMYITLKKQKIIQQYKDQHLKRQAQKQVKISSISAIRDRAKHEKQLNNTLKNLKQMQRTEMIKTKVQKIKQFKKRLSINKQQKDFVQQNNFVMQQQLKMVIMRGRMRETQHKKEQLASKKSSANKIKTRQQSFNNTQSVLSRKSSKNKTKKQQEEVSRIFNDNQTIGQQGSIINTYNKKNNRKTRAQSIGAYLRDPSFVHGVFPQQYYPIQTNGTQFRFPQV